MTMGRVPILETRQAPSET